MRKAKYYDYKNERPLDLELDGCALVDWAQLSERAGFARHPKGFAIFLAPDRIAASDEYADSDPYTVQENIDTAFHVRRTDLTIELLREAVSPVQGTPQILDLGCGQGHITEQMRRAITGAEVTGCDYSISAIEYAHEHFPQVDFAVSDAYQAPYANGFFDVVVCNNLWEHVPDPLMLLRKISKMLRPGGAVIVSTPSRYRVGNLLAILKGEPVTFMSRHHVTEYTVGQVVEQLAYGGFDVGKILSRPIATGNLEATVARWVFGTFIALVGSHHQLEGTVFYLARKRAVAGEQTVPSVG